jgi:uncharacterized protein (DUF305 family)
MNNLRRLALATATAAFLTAPAFAQQSGASTAPSTTDMASTSGTTGTSIGRGPADHAYMQEMQGMQQRMSSARMTGNPDKDFVSMMIPHHRGAIAMAKTELKYGKSAYLKRMARKIVKSQSREIKKMTKWEKKHPNG